MNDEELMRRISDALDAPGGLEGDADLRARLAEDAAASLYAADLQAIDTALAGLASGRSEPDWEAMLERVEGGLGDGALEEIGDPTLAPVFSDDVAEEAPEVIVAADIRAEAQGAKVVDLAARRKRQRLFATIGGLAAAAAVGLGIMVGLQGSPEAPSFAMQDEAEMASAATSEVSAEEVAAPPASVAPAPRSEWAAEAEAPDEADIAGAQTAAPRARAARGRRSAGSRSVFGLGGAGGSGAMAGAPAPSPVDSPVADVAPMADLSAVESPAARNPTRAEVVNALNVVASQVQRCIGQTGELARVHVQVNGATGRIVSTTVAPPYTGLEARCVVRAVRPVQMPRSQHPTYEVDHLYHPAPVAGGSLRPGRPAARRQRRAPAATGREAQESSIDLLSPP